MADTTDLADPRGLIRESYRIDGITLELSQLEYLLALKPVEADRSADARRRMRPAI